MPSAVADPPSARRRAPDRSGSSLSPSAAILKASAAPPTRPSADRLVLTGADWGTYVRLADDPGNAGLKFTFDGSRGLLEIEMAQGPLHEYAAEILAMLVLAFRRERGLRLKPTGSLSLRHPDLGRGADGDKSFYVSSLNRVPPPTVAVVDLAGGAAPPDLVIEVDVTSPGVAKLPIYARLGVKEVWVWEDGAIAVHRLSGDGYEVAPESVELPGFPLTFAAELARDRPTADAGEVEDALAEHLRGG